MSAQRKIAVQHSEPSSKVALEAAHPAIRSALNENDDRFVSFWIPTAVALADGEVELDTEVDMDAALPAIYSNTLEARASWGGVWLEQIVMQ